MDVLLNIAAEGELKAKLTGVFHKRAGLNHETIKSSVLSDWEVQRTEPGKQGHSHQGPFNLAKRQEYLAIHWNDFKKVKMLCF